MKKPVIRGSVAALAAAFIVAIVWLPGCGGPEKQRSFASADEAVTALVAAVQSGDRNELLAVFGPGSEGVIGSGDSIADAKDRARFLAMYQAKHSLVPDGDTKSILQIGENDWPLPVPVVRRGNRWYLDGAAGAEELAFRRVGRNELGAIAVCRGYVRAQRDYSAVGRDGGPAGIFAVKVLSDPGSHNGLYWPTAEEEAPSPIGPWIAEAAAEGYRAGAGRSAPYHGYYYRMLFKQGEHAAGGAADYFMGGQLVGGFALVAWPAHYGISGVQTFLVNQEGVVYQKDLGEDTAATADQIDAYDPDSSWTAVVESTE
jgi:hypothetical protein